MLIVSFHPHHPHLDPGLKMTGKPLFFLSDLKLLQDHLHSGCKSVTVSMGETLSKLLGMINSSFFNKK